MYTLQALWTMARERLDVLTIVFANRRYRILEVEIRRTGATAVGAVADSMMDLSNPMLDWVKLSEGHGVEACRASTSRQFADQLESALHQRGPKLIEVVVSGAV